MVLTKEVIDKVEYIIQQIENGITREQLAEEFGNKDYKALDMYMRRRGYTWDAKLGNYILRDSKVKSNEFRNSKIQSGKVAEIINLFRQGLDAKAVAEQLFFPSHRALAEYMAQQGYVWDIKEKNYVQKVGLDIENDTEVKEIKEPISQVKQVPRYLIPGITKNKNITMSHLLDQLLTDYSREKNIKQKEIVEVALIEFFTKYGYVHEVKALLNR